jgi:hypothetical protein
MTAIYYPDFVVFSPSRSVRLEIHSPDNDPVAPRPVEEAPNSRAFFGGFQSDFIYAAYRTADEHLLWKRQQQPREVSPRWAWVDDAGRAIVLRTDTFSSQLAGLSSGGKTQFTFDVRALLPQNEYCWTTAGSRWEDDSHASMLAIDGRPHWTILTFHERRLLIDLEVGRLVDPQPFSARLLSLEREWVLQTLRDRVDLGLSWSREMREQSDRAAEYRALLAAARFAGILAVDAAIPFLQRLEQSDVAHGHTYSGGMKIEMLTPRQRAQIALRRLNAEPAGLPAFRFSLEEEDERDSQVQLGAREPSAAAASGKLRPGMTPMEIVGLLGSPDAIWPNWEYDFGLQDGCTLRIQLDRKDKHAVAIETIRPPTWENHVERDRYH